MRNRPINKRRSSSKESSSTGYQSTNTKERIAKRLSRAGIASRRDAEKLVLEGRISVLKSGNDKSEKIEHPAFLVTDKDQIFFDDKPIAQKECARLWLYHKPTGLITSHSDPQGRPTVFENLPSSLPRVISIGRLDLNSEGLLLLTNDGELSRLLENPKTALERTYKVRVYGDLDKIKLEELANGCTIDGQHYGPIKVTILSSKGRNSWIEVVLTEGKNREIRKIMSSLGLQVNRLCRLQYGPFKLGNLQREDVAEVDPAKLTSWVKQLGR